MARSKTAIAAGLVLLFWVMPARAGDPADAFRRGSIVVTPQIGGGNAHNFDSFRNFSDVSFVNAAVRVSLLPFDPLGKGALRGALEVGLEPFFQYYTDVDATAEGLKAGARYHFLAGSAIVPYVEALLGVAATSLNVREIDSNHAFFVEGGVGVSYFVGDGMALTLGYRFQHISNAGTDQPNRGLNSSTGVVGLSFFLR